mmetsp:Transcript_12832/g.16249  ORF Transcript_12832/g.16249 Transcript_12832/m.16249 type:complete len:225 (+) Transcript_12832:60-734(+)
MMDPVSKSCQGEIHVIDIININNDINTNTNRRSIQCSNDDYDETKINNDDNNYNGGANKNDKNDPFPLIHCRHDELNYPTPQRPNKTIYMDGVFDLFHYGHLNAIRHCIPLGNRIIIGITGDADAASYKRPPIICQKERLAIVSALAEVDAVVCPCPLVVTEEFMIKCNIDLVVHGFVDDDDAKRQQEFFDVPMKLNKFQRIPYYSGQSTTDILKKIQSMKEEE